MNKKWILLTAIVSCLPSFAICQATNNADVEECLKLEKPDSRLACYDRSHKYQPKKSTEVVERPWVKLKIRDSGTISAVGDADVGARPALFQLGHTDGKDYSTAKIAVIGIVRAIDQPNGFFDGWESFVGTSWDRDTSAKKPKDLRQMFVGITGEIGSPGANGISALPTLRIGYRDDIKENTQGSFANLHVDVIYLPWVNAPERPDKYSLALVPYFGLYSVASHASPSTPQDGSYTGQYAGAKLELALDPIAERLSLTGQYQYYSDASVPSGADKRTLHFESVGLNYDLVDPKAKKGWVPSLSLSWQRGSEPVTGEGPGRKIVLGFGVKFD